MITDKLMHYGVPGMRWGIRRYYNDDGSLTKAGKKRIKKRVGNPIAESRNRGVERARVLSDMNTARLKNRQLNESWKNVRENKNDPESFGKALKKYNDYNKKFMTKWNDKYAGATLRDLGIEDTKSGRNYVQNLLGYDYDDSLIDQANWK
jgi:hypothetical protein